MRRLIPFALLLAAACGRVAASPAEFDPNSADNTLTWFAGLCDEAAKVPTGNEPARAEAQKKLRSTVEAAAKGKTVRWAFRVLSVEADGSCLLEAAERGSPRRYVLGVAALVPQGKGVDGTNVAIVFQTAPPKADWLKTVARGDFVIVTGVVGATVVDVTGDRETVHRVAFRLEGARIEKP